MSNVRTDKMQRETRDEISTAIHRLSRTFETWSKIQTLTERDAQELLRMVTEVRRFLDTSDECTKEEAETIGMDAWRRRPA